MADAEPLLVTYATHAQGMYDELRNSGHAITVGGWGTAWNGFMDKFRYLIEVAGSVAPDDVIIFLDGFDTKIKGDPRLAVARFKTLGCRMLVSTGTLENSLPPLVRKRLFGTAGVVANSGLYMGYAADVHDILVKCTRVAHGGDDQRALNLVLASEPPGRVAIDAERRVFCNLAYSERFPSVYDGIDTVFLGFNGTLDGSRNLFRKVVTYARSFVVEVVVVVVAVAVALAARSKGSRVPSGRALLLVLLGALAVYVAMVVADLPVVLTRVLLGVAAFAVAFNLASALRGLTRSSG